MGWISRTTDAIRAHTRPEPIECPRGWGQVAFHTSVWCVPPLFGIDRKCPIGGVGECDRCAYPPNPDAFGVAAQLEELDRLRDEGRLSETDHEHRTVAVLRLLEEGSAAGRRGLRIAGWILAPIGALIAVAGGICAILVHPGFWGMAGGGGLALVLGLSFWGVVRSSAPRRGG